MDVAGFIDLLTRSGLDVTPLEVAEALWLARYAAPPARQAPGEPPPPAPPGPEPEAEAPHGAGDRDAGTPRAPSDRLPVYLPAVTRHRAGPASPAPAYPFRFLRAPRCPAASR